MYKLNYDIITQTVNSVRRLTDNADIPFNADNSDYTDTIIKAKTEVDKDFIAKLKSVLSSSLTVNATESLSEDSSVPVVVVIGTKK